MTSSHLALSTHGRTPHGTVGLVVAACPTQCWRWNPSMRADLLSKSSWLGGERYDHLRKFPNVWVCIRFHIISYNISCSWPSHPITENLQIFAPGHEVSWIHGQVHTYFVATSYRDGRPVLWVKGVDSTTIWWHSKNTSNPLQGRQGGSWQKMFPNLRIYLQSWKIMKNILTSTAVDDQAYVGVVFFSWNLNPSLNIGVDGWVNLAMVMLLLKRCR